MGRGSGWSAERVLLSCRCAGNRPRTGRQHLCPLPKTHADEPLCSWRFRGLYFGGVAAGGRADSWSHDGCQRWRFTRCLRSQLRHKHPAASRNVKAGGAVWKEATLLWPPFPLLLLVRAGWIPDGRGSWRCRTAAAVARGLGSWDSTPIASAGGG